MSIKVVVGAQWGDEGKGKMVDLLSENADLVVRFQGGDNAGHTVMNDDGTFKQHIIPCGIFRKDCVNLIGTGTAVNPDVLLGEIRTLQAAGISTENLRLSESAQLVMPYHVTLDECMEETGGIGTTRRGIGQAYADKFLRKNLRAGDLKKTDTLKAILDDNLPFINAQLGYFGLPAVNSAELLEKCLEWGRRLSPMLCNGFELIHSYIDAGKNILFEGQLGVMKDIDLGIYPYVTASHPVAAYAAVSSGFPAAKIDEITGVVKAFSSAIGDGPFPTEMNLEESAVLRGSGAHPDDEYGATTGRARRIGWLDLAVLKYAHAVNGFTELALTKLDKLDTLQTIKIATAYLVDGQAITGMPDTDELYRLEPVYESFDGWLQDTSSCMDFESLPENAKKYIVFIENRVGIPIRYIGTGPSRKNIILVK
jgi:adenylosuccinate synthase